MVVQLYRYPQLLKDEVEPQCTDMLNYTYGRATVPLSKFLLI
jgi:hypothetical protein